MSSGRPKLRNVPLLRLLAGFGLLNVSEWGFVAALSVHAFRVGGTLDVGLLGVRFVAGALSSAVLVPLVLSRREMLSVIVAMRAVLLGAAAAMVLRGGPFAAVLLFVVADAVVAAGYRPAQSRLMPSLAHSPEELMSAVAGTSLAKTVGQAAGALFGGAAVEFVSPGTAMAAEAALMLLALLCTAGIGGTPIVIEAGPLIDRLREGLGAFPSVLGDLHAWPLVLASVLRTLVRGLWGALLVVVALRLLHAGSSSVGLLQAVSGLGVLVALPLTVAQIGRSRLALPCLLSFVAAGITVGLVSAATALPVVAVLVFIWGASMAVADATSLSLLHRLLPTEAFSRTVTVMESLKLLTEGAGALLAPVLVALFGLRAALIVGGVPLPLLMIVTWARVRSSDEFAAGRGKVVARLHRVGLFRGLDMASLEQLAAFAQPLSVASGEEPIKQGEAGDRFYVIESGTADVLINGFKITELLDGDEFGERALLRNTPRTATVRARSELKLLAIDREAFLQAMTGEAGVSFQPPDLVYVPATQVLRELPVFSALSESGLRRLADASPRRHLASGTVVFEPGDPSDAAYVILRGRVELQRDGVVSAVLLSGDIFGELSVLHSTPRPGRAVVTEPVVALVLPAAAMLGVARSSSCAAAVAP